MKEVNMITALAGKAAGVQINKNSSGIGGSAKVSLRGFVPHPVIISLFMS